MTDDRRIAERRRQVRRAPVARSAPDTLSQALVPVEPPRAEPSEPRTRKGAFAGFAAQVLGQGGQKRGLRGGPETLDRARSTYLETEWSGPADRRPHPGRIAKTEI